MTQLLLTGTSTSTNANLSEALLLVEGRLATWSSNQDSFYDLLRQVFGVPPSTSAKSAALLASIQASGLGISVQILDVTTMDGLIAAYTSAAPDGGERIYLNAAWLELATAEQIEAVLLEELGHAIDRRLNGSADTAGDEGAIFSALLRGESPDPVAYRDNDQRILILDGIAVAVEASLDTTRPTGSLRATAPAFAAAVTNPFGIENVDFNAAPAFVDADGDGDLDLFIGEFYGNTRFFRNTAAPGATAPAFSTAVTNPFGITDVGSDASPTFADADGDGDLDLFIGDLSGDIFFFRNTAAPGSTEPEFAAAATNPFGIDVVGSFASPAFADADNDGDLDLFIGVNSGNTLFFRNTAAPGSTSPAYAAAENNPFGITGVVSYASPAFADADGDGDLDLFIGNGLGLTFFFRNTASLGSTAPTYAEAETNPFEITDVGASASPAFADADGDGDLDLFIGNSRGNILFFLNTAATPVAPVASATADGTYVIAAVIDITVSFSEAVVVDTSGGTPTLQLETGTIDRKAIFESGSGSSTLTFRYTVQEGDTSADLDQLSSTALELNGGSIADAAGNNAILTLAEPGEQGSLGANAALVIDGVVPTVTGVDSTTADGSYGIGDVIDITVALDEVVFVTGTPTLQLETGSTDRKAIFESGSGSSTLTFRYTVQAGDTSADLDQLSSTALELNGGSIADAAGNNAILTLADPGEQGSLGANAALVIDTTRPTGSQGSFATAPAYAAAVTNPFGITNVGSFASPAFADADNDGDLDLFIGNIAGNTLFFRNTAAPGSTTPAYATAETNPFGITDVEFNASPAFADADADGDGDLDLFIGNKAGDTVFFRNTAAPGATSPAFSTAETNPFGITDVGRFAKPSFADADGDGDLDLFIGNGDGNTLFFRNTAAPGSTEPEFAAAAFNPFGITDVAFSASPTLADIDGDGDLDLFIGEYYGNTAFFRNTAPPGSTTPAYAAAVTNPLGITDVGSRATPAFADADGDGDLDLFIGNSVGNTLFFRNTAATPVAPVDSTTPDGTYGIGDVIDITVSFSEAVVVDTTGGTPTLQLETGSTDRKAIFVSGSGSTTLTFRYTVQDGDTSADLDQLSSTALELNGGTIADAAGNNAILTLADPGEAGSLGANAALVIDGVAPTISVAINDGSDGFLNAAEDGSVTIDGTTSGVEDGQTVSISITDGTNTVNTSATVNSNSYSVTGLDLSSLNDGTLTIKADVSDLAGNAATQATDTTTKDTTSPTISVAINDGSDGVLNAAEDGSVTIDGTTSGAEDDQSVSISITDGTNTVNTSATVNSNSYSVTGLDLSSLNDGTLTIKADVSDLAGNAATQATDTTTKDTTSPTISVAINDGSDGVLNAAEDGSVTIDGTTSGVEDGQTVSISITDGTNTVNTSATVNSNSYSVTGLDLSSLNDGTLTIKADVSDLAGNAATQATDTTTKDTTSPTISVAINDGSDGVLNAAEDGSVTIDGTTSGAEDDQSVSISITDGTNTVNTSATVNSNSYSVTGLDLSSLNDGTLTIKADVSDLAGNAATQATDTTTKDTTSPTISVAINDGSDGFLNAAEDGSVTISGTTSGAEDDQSVSISITDGTNTVDTSATVNSNSYSVTGLDLSSLNDGTLTIKADVSDLAGNAATQATDTTTKDTTAPQTSRVDSTTPDGSYGIGAVIDITVAFDEIVFVTGTPALQLETGSTDRKAIFESGSGSSTLTFRYTVQAGDTSADLDQLSSTALELNGGSIADAAGNNAILTLADPGATGSLSSNADLVIDGIKPTVSTDTRTYVLEASNPFGISDVGLSAKPTFADIDGDDDLDLFIANRAGNTLFFRNTAASGSTAPAYAPAVTNPFGITDVGRAASPTLTDIDDDGDLDLFIGNRAGNTLFFRNNAAPGSTAPAYSQERGANGAPNPFGITDVGRFAKPSFTDTDNDGDLDLFIGNLRGNTLFFRNTAAAGSTSPAYAPAATNPFGINDVGLSAAPAFTDIDGDGDLDLFIGNRDGNTLVFRNNAPPGSTAPAYSQERGANGAPNPFGITDVGFNASPAFADPDNDSDPDLFIGNAAGDTIFFRNTGAAPGVNTSAINGIYTIGAVINLTIGFSKPVVVDTTGGTPTLQLETGNIDRKAVFISGSGTNTLSFQYTVQDGDSSPDLDQLSSTALELNGGSITDANGNPAILSLPQPGTQGSLSDNADLIIDTNDLITSTIRSSESLTLPDGLANLILTGTANLNGTGNDLDNRIEGNSGKNRLNGKGGNDTLIGKEDKDKLTGGSDADTFLFQSINDSGITNATRDQITDFTADDTIDLSRIDADPNTNGDQAFVFIGSDRFSDIGQARFSNAVLRLNIDDDLFADFQINLKGVTDLPDNSLIL
ncbi:FG-GAP-like repeat-containing protein [Synechococcus sp. A10-1-5-9]|uniref:FG-GAP-like repeat-containing protein n=1 Tax=Synechococcus sp. A10-1-5-9 TaxID=3392295 RepID=UPI0039ED3B71